ncbi:MAG: hypothetical protein R3C03_23095 [Pirellulaceae bacterium]
MKSLFIALASTALIASIAVGCNSTPADNSQSTKIRSDAHDDEGTDHSREGHSHGAGPHDGAIADWGGGKFHVEFTVDHDQKQATVYIYGSDEKTATPIDATEISLAIKEPSLTTTLKAVPQDGDTENKSSRFVGTHEGLGVVRDYEGTISGVIDGTPYSGNFSEIGHDH